MSDFKYIIFDWNGTLIDDLQMNLDIEDYLLSERNLPHPLSKEFYLENFGFPIKDFYELCGFDFQKESYFDIAEEYRAEYKKRMKDTKLFEDVIPMLENLKKSGYKLLIVSATEQSVLISQVESYGIYGYFDKVIGIENNLGKSKVQAALDWFSQQNIHSENVLFVGDTVHDSETAKAIGCECFLVPRGHNSRRRLEETGAQIFSSLEEISERLCKG